MKLQKTMLALAPIWMTGCASLLTGKATPQAEPPRCAREAKVENFTGIDAAAFAPAPEPLIMPPGADYGDAPGVIAAARQATKDYNATVIANLRTQNENGVKSIDVHNTGVDKRNAACDVLWKAWEDAKGRGKRAREKAIESVAAE